MLFIFIRINFILFYFEVTWNNIYASLKWKNNNTSRRKKSTNTAVTNHNKRRNQKKSKRFAVLNVIRTIKILTHCVRTGGESIDSQNWRFEFYLIVIINEEEKKKRSVQIVRMFLMENYIPAFYPLKFWKKNKTLIQKHFLEIHKQIV